MNADTGAVLWRFPAIGAEEEEDDDRFSNPCDLCLVPLPENEAALKVPSAHNLPFGCELRHLVGTTTATGELLILQPFADAPHRLRIRSQVQLPALTYVPARRCIVALDQAVFVVDLTVFLRTGNAEGTTVVVCKSRHLKTVFSGATWIADDTLIVTPWETASPTLVTLSEETTRCTHKALHPSLGADAGGCCVDNRGNIVLLHCEQRKLIVFR